ncbi:MULTISPECIES: response regulator transcription factor [Pseudidiomarina]|uniref:Two-component system OmpR family response regulator/two-component system response regulator QseB n=3 Tax=Pseudidiomarina TaxID=2800384 RepID=A0A368UNV8_9GAMM|nr:MULTISPECIES: response regulator transcription factor [Pseudidiomarina]MDT7525468.1 response regulator transcription factor [Pseudidiomarina sp. GXY010]PWW11186.1 two-component system OmpR family response regulator/two-component system response regulator QseB [Pseudidiomarina maritima]RBP88514.1 two-component system OmpR family response regulator/two-component system response regulator QseB [Pseudidiomarina tainanensis]RCW30466.1 two-component system OmpR family response regulator/two-compon
MHILLVEDDAMLGQAVALGLNDRGFNVAWVQTGAAAISALQHHAYQAMILDLGLPDLEGSRVLINCRKRGLRLPILILTARDNSHEIVQQLDNGADDYLTKPFDLNELGARLRALIRRQQGHTSATLSLGELQLNTETRVVQLQQQPINLSRREFELLKALILQPGRVHSRDQLEASVFDQDTDIESNALEVHVSNLRKKLGNKEWIETIRGIGYRLKQPGQGAQ